MAAEPVQKLLKMAALVAILDSESQNCPDASRQVSIQSGGHLGYGNRTILENLNLYVVSMPAMKFWFNLSYSRIL